MATPIVPGQTVRGTFRLTREGFPGLLRDVRATAVVNGSDTLVPVTVENPAPGFYVASYTVPAGWVPDDVAYLRLDAEHEGQSITSGLLRLGVVVDTTSLDADEIAAAVWDAAVQDYAAEGSFGERVGKKVLTLRHWLGSRPA